MSTKLSQLKRAKSASDLIRFSRRFNDSSIHGYVLDLGPTFFLLALVSDRIWFDGFECFRIGDVFDFIPDPNAEFVEEALRCRRECLQKKPPVELSNIKQLLLSASQAFPLITIHRELVDSRVCQIGRLLAVDGGRVSLLEIDPNAKWHKSPRKYRMSEITRVSFGGDYEDALSLVGGNPPE